MGAWDAPEGGWKMAPATSREVTDGSRRFWEARTGANLTDGDVLKAIRNVTASLDLVVEWGAKAAAPEAPPGQTPTERVPSDAP